MAPKRGLLYCQGGGVCAKVLCPLGQSNRASHRSGQHLFSAGGALLAGPLLEMVCNDEEGRTI